MRRQVIYKIVNPEWKVYIWQSNNWDKRYKQYFNLSCKPQVKIYNSLYKYWPNNHKFEIIREFEKHIDQEYLDFRETFYYNEYIQLGELLNLKECWWSRWTLSEESRKKLSESRKWKWTWDRAGRPRKWKKIPEYARKKMSEARKWKYIWINHPMRWKHHTQDTRDKISKWHLWMFVWSKSVLSKINEEDVIEMRRLHEHNWLNWLEISKIFNYNHSWTCKILKWKIRKHI